MRTSKAYSWWVALAGWVLFVTGLFGTIQDFLARPEFLIPPDLGIFLGDGAFVMMGLLGILIAKGLKSVEERLDRMEKISPLTSGIARTD
jgi:hypothetical protein